MSPAGKVVQLNFYQGKSAHHNMPPSSLAVLIVIVVKLWHRFFVTVFWLSS